MNDTSRRRFKMPHLLWLMISILVLASIATYLIPAGEFAVDEDGAPIPGQFTFLPEQDPVGPIDLLLMLLDGLIESAPVIFAVMLSGASVTMVLESRAFDNILNWATFRLQDKGSLVLVSVLFCLMVYIGGFAGSDALIAMVPVGLLFARKLNLDPISAMGVTTFATLIGFGTGPQAMLIPQLLIGLPPYSGFVVRFAIMNVFMVIGLAMMLLYVRKIERTPQKSLMWAQGWRPGGGVSDADVDETLTDEKLSWRSVAIIAVFLASFGVIVTYSSTGGEMVLNVMVAVMFVAAIINGIIAGFGPDKIAETIGNGLASMALIGFIIGLARVMALILTEGQILDTIVYVITQPLSGVGAGVAAIVLLLIFAAVNFLIPSATSKAAIFIPIVAPVAETVGMHPQIAIQAFQFGDGFTNLISPVLAWLIGSCVMAGVPYGTWVRWVFPKVLIFLAVSIGILYLLWGLGWTGL